MHWGHQIWRDSGLIPDPQQLMGMDPRWLSDLTTYDTLIQQQLMELDTHDDG